MNDQRIITQNTLPAMRAQATAAVQAAQAEATAAAAAKSQADTSKTLADETKRANQRTWLAMRSTEGADVEEINISCDATPMSRKTNVTPLFINAGKSPASDLRIVWNLGDRGRVQLPPKPPHIDVARLGPGQTQFAGSLNIGDAFPNEYTFQQVISGQLKLQAWGTIDYCDAFGPQHREFQMTWRLNTPCEFEVDTMR